MRWLWGGHQEGKKGGGRPKTTRRRTVESKRRSAGWRSRKKVKTAARDRVVWRGDVAALCVWVLTWRELSANCKVRCIVN